MKQFITPSGIINVNEVAELAQQPKIAKNFKPAMHPNDRIKIAYAKRNVENRQPKKFNSFAALCN